MTNWTLGRASISPAEIINLPATFIFSVPVTPQKKGVNLEFEFTLAKDRKAIFSNNSDICLTFEQSFPQGQTTIFQKQLNIDGNVDPGTVFLVTLTVKGGLKKVVRKVGIQTLK